MDGWMGRLGACIHACMGRDSGLGTWEFYQELKIHVQ